MVAAVVFDPVREDVAADGARIVSVHIFEETLAIKLKLVTLGLALDISLNKKTGKGGELLEPAALVQVTLFKTETAGVTGATARSG